jgi:uncharacterized protein YndB with AHSA1/START domain
MERNLVFDFKINKENNTINVKREFAANLEHVWEAWTKPEILNQWWAPKPYHIETKSLELRDGGMWLYAMVSPEGEKQWCKAEYNTVSANKSLSWLDAFCDENGIENTEKPRSFWTINFSEQNGITTVNVALRHDNREDVEKMTEMGFKEGFSMALENLDEVLLKK